MTESSEQTYDVLLQGTPFWDLTFTFTDVDALPCLGHEAGAQGFAMNPGASFNVASALSRFGLRVGLVAQLGTDVFSRLTAERMKECGLSLVLVSWVDEPLPLVSVGVSFPHDRLFITYDAFLHTTLPPRRITIDHLDRYRPRALLTHGGIDLQLCREARRRGVLVLLDAYWDRDHLRSVGLRELARSVDIFSPNLPEALEMTGTDSAEQALDVLSGWSPCVVIKTGPGGCLAYHQGERIALPAIPVEAIETTGAGDNFNAGLLYGLLRGRSFQRSLRYANIAGGLSTLVLGGCGSRVTGEDLERHVEQYYGHDGVDGRDAAHRQKAGGET